MNLIPIEQNFETSTAALDDVFSSSAKKTSYLLVASTALFLSFASISFAEETNILCVFSEIPQKKYSKQMELELGTVVSKTMPIGYVFKVNPEAKTFTGFQGHIEDKVLGFSSSYFTDQEITAHYSVYVSTDPKVNERKKSDPMNPMNFISLCELEIKIDRFQVTLVLLCTTYKHLNFNVFLESVSDSYFKNSMPQSSATRDGCHN